MITIYSMYADYDNVDEFGSWVHRKPALETDHWLAHSLSKFVDITQQAHI